ADNVTEAVADAVRAAVVQAVQTVLTEVLTNPAVLMKLRDALPPPPTPKAVSGPRLRERLSQAWAWMGRKLKSMLTACRDGLNGLAAAASRQYERAQKFAKETWMRLRVLRHFRGQLLLALMIGVAGGLGVFLAGPWLAALLGGLGSFLTAVAVQGGVLLLRLATASGLPRT